jgi:tRNA pseudouridine13 synthase
MTLVINAFPLDFPCAYGQPSLHANFRERPEDFYVEEMLGFSMSGEGEHLCLYIEKQGDNTHWVTAELARFSGIDERDIGVCGRKDRHAITRQWFSLYDPMRRSIDWEQFTMDGTRILKIVRHHKKLRLGDHQDNRFVIRLRDIVDAGVSPPSILPDAQKQQVLAKVTDTLSQGVPNYFGVQRFGRGGGNLVLANEWLTKKVSPPRKQRSMVLSAARSYLFNRVLAARVSSGQWTQIIDGDVISNDYPTGPLWGRGRLATSDDALIVEQNALTELQPWCERLEYQGLKQERRDLVLIPKALSCFWENDDLILSFDLPSGTFATALLAELAILQNQAGSPSSI